MSRNKFRGVNARYEYPPLHMAAKEGNLEKIAQLLRQGADVNQLARWSETPLYFAASEGTSLQVVKMLVKAGADVNLCEDYDDTPLMRACRYGHGSIVSYLLKKGADVNARDFHGWTPLRYAIRATSLSLPLISTLLKAKARINACDRRGETPLHAIVARRDKFHDGAKWEVLKLLLSYECNINAKTEMDGATPLLTALLYNDRKSALMLIRAGCEVDTEDRWGRLPMFHAIMHKLYLPVELLLAAGQRISRGHWMDLRGQLQSEDPSMLERLLAVGAECPRLSIMCRKAFYDHYGTEALNQIKSQPLPSCIKRYLSFEIL